MNATVLSLDRPDQIVVSRLLDAQRDRVFDAFTRAEHLAQWWAPAGFTVSTRDIDVRAGGLWHYTLHGPDGTRLPNRVAFLVVDPPSRLVYSNDGEGGGPPWFHVTVTLEARGDRTHLVLRALFPDAAARDEALRLFDAAEAARQTVDRLAATLVALPHPRDLVAAGTVQAPRERVWRAWTDASLRSRWWGPRRLACVDCELDPRVDGSHRVRLRDAHGAEYPARGRVVDLVEPCRLVLTLDCSEHPAAWHDAVRADRGGDEPNPAGVMLLTADFEPVPSGGTRVTVRIHLHSAAVRDVLLAMGLQDDWGESLQRLAALCEAPPE